jgi:ATP-dependent Clp protease ATP-binding subunit ClpC
MELEKVSERLRYKKMDLELGPKAKDFLINKGYNPDFGARPLRRAISTYIEDALAESLLAGEYEAGQLIKVTHVEDNDHLSFEAAALPKSEAATENGDQPEEAVASD